MIRIMSATIAAYAALTSIAFAVQTLSTLSCPANLSISEHVESLPLGWMAESNELTQEYRLAEISFSDGPPVNKVFLNPLTTTKTHHSVVERYDFRDPSFGKIWILCSYRESAMRIDQETDFRGKVCAVKKNIEQKTESVTVSCE